MFWYTFGSILIFSGLAGLQLCKSVTEISHEKYVRAYSCRLLPDAKERKRVPSTKMIVVE